MIVSEAGGRPASFVTPGRSRLSRLEGCGPWIQVPQDESEAERRATEAAAWVIGGMAIFFPKFFADMPLARGELHYWMYLA
ncbi:hypothetical protein IMZ48_08045 [Candidatus Bathyarchaeota archaeon]|nr:hypothetical protein [Candidatus Bathyarchaeota archaeon]